MRACVLLTFAAVLLLATTAQAQVRSSLCISADETTHECNIVSNGVLNPAWADGTWLITTSVQPMFNITLLDGSTTAETVKVDYAAVGGATNAIWQMATETTTFGAGYDTPFNGTMLCATENNGTFSVTVTVTGYTPLVIQFYKMCVMPRFDIGSFNNGNNIMMSNVPQDAFSAYTLTQDVQNYDFHVYLSDVQADPWLLSQPFSLEVVSGLPDHLAVNAASVQGWDGLAMQKKYFEEDIPVMFRCVDQPDPAVKVPLTATLQNFGWVDSANVQIHFEYICGVSLPMPGLNVGTMLGYSDVAVNGVAVAPWNTTFHYGVDSTNDFILWFASTTVHDPVPWKINIISYDSAILIVNPTRGDMNGTLIYEDGEARSQVFLSEIICAGEGTTKATVQLVMGYFDPINVMFDYTCSAPLFNVGTSAGSANIISRGVAAAPGWAGSHVNSNVPTLDIFLQLAPDNVAETNEFQIVKHQIDTNVISDVYVYDRLNATVTKDAARSAANPVTIHFQCKECVTSHGSEVVMHFPWGWAQQQSVTFYKDCQAAPSCNGGGGGGGGGGESGHHGMTAAGTAALVIFFLAFGACVAGCAYNKFSLHKSGWSVVPGANSAAHCFDSVSTGGRNARWTPQEHDDNHAALNSSANYNAGASDAPLSASGGGYQSYSSNL